MNLKPGDIVKILLSIGNIDARVCYAIVINKNYLSHYDILIQGNNIIHRNVNSIYLYPADHDGYMVIYDPELPF